MKLYIGLIHYPVYNKNRRRIASAITNFDLHDLSRAARTYGVKRFFMVTPLLDQQELAARIVQHWKAGYGAMYNPHRREALELVRVSSSLQEAVGEIESLEGEGPLLIATDAGRQEGKALSYAAAKAMVRSSRPIFLLFGTAWGLDREILESVDYVLNPILGTTEYNHLSVRAAAAIILDRLAGGPE
ncbi:MAG: RNA methyltransferase [Desulfobacteraceae bacterium]|nr:MAG: RNA methyltransferase [Desulfobacteraceae bacterium]